MNMKSYKLHFPLQLQTFRVFCGRFRRISNRIWCSHYDNTEKTACMRGCYEWTDWARISSSIKWFIPS